MVGTRILERVGADSDVATGFGLLVNAAQSLESGIPRW